MKTTLIDAASVVPAKAAYPCLYAKGKFTVLATSTGTGVGLTPDSYFGVSGGTDDLSWEDTGWSRITTPITIRFDPAE